MKRSWRQTWCYFLLGLTLAPAQSKKPLPDQGLVLPPIIIDKKKVKEIDQAPPKQIELPAAATAETARLSFEVAPVSSKGLLSQQTRDGLRALLRDNRGATVVKLRAFVSGSGDLRRVGEIAGEVFGERRLSLPALTVVQVGALPVPGEQVTIEATEMERREVNPNGLAFISGQAGDGLPQALDRVLTAAKAVGSAAGDVLRVSCFVSSLDQESANLPRLQSVFPQAATLVAQMQRGPVRPAAECEAVARLAAPPGETLKYVNPADLAANPNYSQVALVPGSAKLVFTSLQLGFGTQDADLKLVFERLRRLLSSYQTGFDQLVVSSVYLTDPPLAPKIRNVRKQFYRVNPASMLLPFEGLPSNDSSVAIDLIALTP